TLFRSPAGHLLGALGLALTGTVEEDERVEVAVPGVEDVGDPYAALGGELLDLAQHLRQRGARDDAVLHEVVGADPAHRGEGGLAALPDEGPLGVVLRHPGLGGAVRPAQPAAGA